MTKRWSYRNDTSAPVKVRVGSRAYALAPGETIDVPEGQMAMSSQSGRLTRLEHQAPRARYFAADRSGVLQPNDGTAPVCIGDDVAPELDVEPPGFDEEPPVEYGADSDDTSDEDDE